MPKFPLFFRRTFQINRSILRDNRKHTIPLHSFPLQMWQHSANYTADVVNTKRAADPTRSFFQPNKFSSIRRQEESPLVNAMPVVAVLTEEMPIH